MNGQKKKKKNRTHSPHSLHRLAPPSRALDSFAYSLRLWPLLPASCRRRRFFFARHDRTRLSSLFLLAFSTCTTHTSTATTTHFFVPRILLFACVKQLFASASTFPASKDAVGVGGVVDC